MSYARDTNSTLQVLKNDSIVAISAILFAVAIMALAFSPVAASGAAPNADAAYYVNQQVDGPEGVFLGGATGAAVTTGIGYAGTKAGAYVGAKYGGLVGSYAGPVGTAAGVIIGGGAGAL